MASLRRCHDVDEREKMLLSAPIHLLESSEQPHRPGRPHQSERLVDVVRDLLRPGRRLVKECDWHLELVGDPGWWAGADAVQWSATALGSLPLARKAPLGIGNSEPSFHRAPVRSLAVVLSPMLSARAG